MNHVAEETSRADSRKQCKVCGRLYETTNNDCPGAKVYRWEPWPEGLFTERQIKAKGLIPGPLAGVIPYSKAKDGKYLYLYRESEASPKPLPTDKQIVAREKARRTREARRICGQCGEPSCYTTWEQRTGICGGCYNKNERAADRLESAKEAYQLICEDDFVVWDSETTDLNGRFVEIAAVTPHGRVLFNERIAPQILVAEGAFEVHGILDAEIVACPTFADIYPTLRRVLDGQRWVIYNSAFDTGVLEQELHQAGLHPGYGYRSPIQPRSTICAMELFAQFYGELHPYYRSYTWQKLDTAAATFTVDVEYAAHSALSDCLRTLEVLYGMAEYYTREALA